MSARPIYRLSLEGVNLGLGPPVGLDEVLAGKLMETMGARLMSLSLTEKREGGADQLDIRLHDFDGRLEIPKPGQVLALKLGWESGAQVLPGLVDKGRFKVDAAEWEGWPSIITIRARSADFAAGIDRRLERSHVDRTLRSILDDIATARSLALSIDDALGAEIVPVFEQDELSDAAMLRWLGARFDAAATVKNGTLIFARIGNSTSASGAPLPSSVLTPSVGDRVHYKRGERGQFGGVEARWHDRRKGKRSTVAIGGGEGGRPPKRLKRIYASEKTAQDAADAANRRMSRAAATCELALALGRPEIYPEQRLQLQGFKPEIDAQAWLVAEARHSLESSGLRSQLRLEVA